MVAVIGGDKLLLSETKLGENISASHALAHNSHTIVFGMIFCATTTEFMRMKLILNVQPTSFILYRLGLHSPSHSGQMHRKEAIPKHLDVVRTSPLQIPSIVAKTVPT